MTCPSCGSESHPDQNFCRVCGASLQTTSLALGEIAKASVPGSTSTVDLQERTFGGHNLARWGLIIMFIGVAIGVVGKMLLHEDIVTVVGVIVALLGMFLTAYPYMSPFRSKQSVTGTDPKTKELTPSQPTTYLPQAGDVDFMPSITERTTNLLKTPTLLERDTKKARPRSPNSEDD